jgi:hypothetical protein
MKTAIRIPSWQTPPEILLMIQMDASRPVHFCDGLRRRDLLHAGALGVIGLSLADLFALEAARAAARTDTSCIVLMLVGAPNQLDTWDMKPEAPSEIRGPYKPIATNVPGIRNCEIFPRMAALADKYALVRSVHSPGVAVHDAGHQVMQTGRLFKPGLEYPHIASILGRLRGRTTCPHTSSCRARFGRRAGTCRTARGPGFSGRRTSRSCSMSTRPSRRSAGQTYGGGIASGLSSRIHGATCGSGWTRPSSGSSRARMPCSWVRPPTGRTPSSHRAPRAPPLISRGNRTR